MLGGDPGPMRSRSGIESAFIPHSWRGFVQPRMGRQFLAWRRQPQGIPNEPTIILSPRRGRQSGWPGPTSAVSGREPLENQGPVDFSVTIRLVSLPGFYWTYDLYRHPNRLVENPLVRLGSRATTNPQNSVLVGRQNDRRDLVSRQQVANRRP